MNKKQMMKRIIGLSLLAGLFLPIVLKQVLIRKTDGTLSAIAKRRTQRLSNC